MTEAEVGYKAVAYIWQDTAIGTGNVPLGTDVDEGGTLPIAPKWERIVGVTSISIPLDNSPTDVTEIGTRIIQRFAGALGLSGRIEKWAQNGEWWGACLGYYTVATKKYSKGDDLIKFKVRVYTGVPFVKRDLLLNQKFPNDGALDTACLGYSEMIELIGVKFGSYDTSEEPNAGIKETIAYTAEDMTVVATA